MQYDGCASRGDWDTQSEDHVRTHGDEDPREKPLKGPT